MADENAAVSRRLVEEGWSQGNLSIVDELVDAQAVGHDPSLPEEVRGPEGLKRQISMYRAAFPDVHFTIEDEVAQGDKVVLRWTARGTHRGELMGLAPTGRAAKVTGVTIDKIADGKVVESWVEWDNLGLAQQIGAAPPPGSVGERIGKGVQRLAARRFRRQAEMTS
jgi:predicted ester cyclase